MFGIIETTKENNESIIEFHGYTNNEETAIQHVKNYLLQSIALNNTKIYKINKTHYDNLIDNQNGRVLHQFNLIEIDRISDDVCEEILTYICQINNIEKKNITIKHFIENFVDNPHNLNKLNNEFDITDIIGDKPDIQKYIIEYLILMDYANIIKELKLHKSELNKIVSIILINPLL